MSLIILISLVVLVFISGKDGFQIEEATIEEIHKAFNQGKLTSRQLTQHYLNRIKIHNPLLHAIIEVNPDALTQAGRADRERQTPSDPLRWNLLHGIPVLLKDMIATRDRLNSTAGSLALLGSVVARDAGVVRRLRKAGAVILGKASMSEWAHFRSFFATNGWSPRGGQPLNPYVLWADPCGSSTGSAIAVATNMVTVSLGTETDGSILCPTTMNSVVGIKPTVGLTSRAGVIPVSPRQDTIGPICRTVSDAVHVLEVIAGYDKRDEATKMASSHYIPQGGYKQFLNMDGLKTKKLGILRKGFFEFPPNSIKNKSYEDHFKTIRQSGAILVDNLEIENISVILDSVQSGAFVALLAEFKLSLDQYLSELVHSPVRSLMDIIDFNNQHADEERMVEFGQHVFLEAENTNGINTTVERAISNLAMLCKEGLEKLMVEKELDAIITPDATISTVLAIGGYPGISVPAGYGVDGVPFSVCFGGLKGSEPKLIEIAYAFEQSTKVRKPTSI